MPNIRADLDTANARLLADFANRIAGLEDGDLWPRLIVELRCRQAACLVGAMDDKARHKEIAALAARLMKFVSDFRDCYVYFDLPRGAKLPVWLRSGSRKHAEFLPEFMSRFESASVECREAVENERGWQIAEVKDLYARWSELAAIPDTAARQKDALALRAALFGLLRLLGASEMEVRKVERG